MPEAPRKPDSPRGLGTKLAIGALLGCLGFAVVAVAHTNEVDESYAGYRNEELIDILNGLTGTQDRAEREIARLEKAQAELQSDTSKRQAAIDQARKEANTLAILAGRVPVTGSGIKVTITPAGEPPDIEAFIDLVQELRTAGAESLEFNNEVRVVASTSFDAIEGAIVVDGVELAGPIVVDAIGAPSTLRGAIDFALGPRAQFEDDGASVKIDELPELKIMSTTDRVEPDFARDAGGG